MNILFDDVSWKGWVVYGFVTSICFTEPDFVWVLGSFQWKEFILGVTSNANKNATRAQAVFFQ